MLSEMCNKCIDKLRELDQRLPHFISAVNGEKVPKSGLTLNDYLKGVKEWNDFKQELHGRKAIQEPVRA